MGRVRYPSPVARPFAIVLTTIVALASFVACSRSARKALPVASLSVTSEAAAAFVPLREAWAARKLDVTALEGFVARYPRDGATPLAKVYLAFSLMEHRRFMDADGVLRSLADLAPGETRDLATVARARSLRLSGAPEAALDSLRPLVGKMVDDADREVFLEEVAVSAIAAHDDYEALAYLDAWLRGVGEDDKDIVMTKIEQILEALPRVVLEQTYRAMRARGAASGYGSDSQRLVRERLARIAVKENDASLARWLVDESGVSATEAGGDAGLELGDLAASRRGLAAVTGRTVGLLLPTRVRELRDEAADVVRGISWALDLPRSPEREPGARLVTRDDGGGVAGTRAAMEELVGEGASIIVGGFDRASADRVVAWSDESGVPVLLLSAPTPSKTPRKAAVVLGERTENEVALLGEALVRRGIGSAAFLVDTEDDEAAGEALDAASGLALLAPIRCDRPLSEAGKSRFPIDTWWRSGLRGWLVSGSPGCARDLLRDLGTRYKPPNTAVIALTLEAGVPMSEVPKGIVVLSAAAGIVPVLAARPEDAHDDDVRGFMERFGVRPSYWTALGHDAGVFAKAALAPLPKDTTTDPNAVSHRRAIAQAGLLATRVRLWTSDESGVGADRAIVRRLRLVTWEKDSK